MRTFLTISHEQQPSAVALGFFDGVHMGHRKVLGGAAAQRSNGLTPVCLTFSQSPKSIISDFDTPFLMTRADKLKALEAIGIEHVYFADFRSVMHLSARDFFAEILVKTLNAKALFCGFNYRFGWKAEGDIKLLQRLCVEHGVRLVVAPPQTDNGEVVCSTLIKRLISDGNIERANRLLCGRFGIREIIRSGRRLGRSMGTPTLNQQLTKGLTQPKLGVYASIVTLESGKTFCGVTNIGIRPTVGGGDPLWETWMPEYSGGEIYGQTADVRLIAFIRDERKFDSLEALKAEIVKNGAQALEIYSSKINSL